MSQPESLLIRLGQYGLAARPWAGGQIEAEGMNDWLQQWLDVAEADALRRLGELHRRAATLLAEE